MVSQKGFPSMNIVCLLITMHNSGKVIKFIAYVCVTPTTYFWYTKGDLLHSPTVKRVLYLSDFDWSSVQWSCMLEQLEC